MPAYEVNFDGLVGPTHNYAGLSYGNIASTTHKLTVSNPKQAALQGLAKMKFMHDLGLKQGILPPHERPHIPTLRKLGFSGADAQIIEKAFKDDPALLSAVYSASSMWAANAATVSPSADTEDHRVHFTPANLITQFHRSIESPTTTRVLRAIFHDESAFAVHDPLPAAAHFSDEGAANHMRFCDFHDRRGLEVFVFGRRAFENDDAVPRRFPARQTCEAAAAIARNHLLHPDHVMLVRQHPQAIDAGAFHNDVVAVANQNTLLCHRAAYAESDLLSQLSRRGIRVFTSEMSYDDAVRSYVFNSQLVSLPDGTIALIAPTECREVAAAEQYIERLVNEGAAGRVHYVDVRQSMQNGGGPACLRLRVVLNDQELHKVHSNVMFTPDLYDALERWVNRHYRSELRFDDLRDPKLIDESRAALEELCVILQIGSIYDFQRG